MGRENCTMHLLAVLSNLLHCEGDKKIRNLLETDTEKISRTSQKETSGASTVAIDNKIEQAMDLVKSHLMFAVREEVEVLKEQIKELLEKNSQLEYENSILKAAATPETLAKLKQSNPQPATTSS